MAPLPGGPELDSELYGHENSLIVRQMQNKIAVISALLAHMMTARSKRA